MNPVFLRLTNLEIHADRTTHGVAMALLHVCMSHSRWCTFSSSFSAANVELLLRAANVSASCDDTYAECGLAAIPLCKL